ncbi:MAG TPA: cytochrome c peroxidase [Polyangiaceae bacterium]
MKTTLLGFGTTMLLALVGCQEEAPVVHKRPPVAAPVPSVAPGIEIDSAKLALYTPLPDAMESKANPSTPDKVALGRMLFFDQRLSKSQETSCNTCHDLEKFGVDGNAVPTNGKGPLGLRNTPTVYNAALAFVQDWDGRSETVEDQAKDHLTSPTAMAATSAESVIDTLKSVPGYVDAFKKAFPDDDVPMSAPNLAKAIGAFERKLVTPSKWDRYLKGDKSALGEDEKKGFLAFIDTGCAACHMGPLVGGIMYQKLGLVKPWPNAKDKGRSLVTKSASDDMMFKASALRNIERTAPYFHDGSTKTLEEAVKMMATYQLNKELSDETIKSIVTWFAALTGAPPSDLVGKPALPESPAKAQKPAKK